MILFLAACAAGLIPFTVLYLFLKNRSKDNEAYRKLCKKALVRGVLCVFPVLLLSGTSYFLIRMTGIQDRSPLLYEILYKFIVLALAEEVAKFLAFRKILKKENYPFSWLDMAVFMSIVGIGFGLLESIILFLGANIPEILIRAVCFPHAGYGYLTGYYYGKGIKNGNAALKWTGFVLAWLIHGLYDLSLSDVFLELNDNLVFLPFILCAVDIILVVRLVSLVRKKSADEAYTAPLLNTDLASESAPEDTENT